MAEHYDCRELNTVKHGGSSDIEITELRCSDERNNYWKNIPRLPNNKVFHMFVCYIQEDAEDVRIIVDNLEENGVKCCYHERDFLPGQQVIGNIHESINRSMSILIVLSENFVQSRFCKHEIEQALHANIEEDYTIIPIKIQRCEIPNVLKNYTHIDAEFVDPNERHLRILKAFISNVWNSREDFKSNGFTLRCLLSRYTISWRCLSLYRYKMVFDAASRRNISRSGFEISDELLDEVGQIVSDSDYIKYFHISNKFIRMTTFVFAMLFWLVFDVAAFVCEFVYLPTVNKQKEEIQQGVLYGLLAIISIWFLIICIHGLGLCLNSKRWKGITRGFKERTKTQLMRKLWTKINKYTFEKNDFIFIFKTMAVHIIRFDRKPCRNFFVRRCSVNEDLRRGMLSTETLQEYADRLFYSFMEENIEMLFEESLTPGRHTMKNGAKCLCQLVQETLLPEEI